MSEAMNRVATIRAATCGCPGHRLPAIGRLGALLVRMHHDFDWERFIAAQPRTKDAYTSFIGRQIGKSSVVLIVAERDGKMLGYAYAGIEVLRWSAVGTVTASLMPQGTGGLLSKLADVRLGRSVQVSASARTFGASAGRDTSA